MDLFGGTGLTYVWIAVAVVILLLFAGLAYKFGLFGKSKGGKQEEEIDKFIASKDNPFDSSYKISPKGFTLTNQKIAQLAAIIWREIEGNWADHEKILASINQIPTKDDFHLLATIFNSTTKEDLYSGLQRKLSTDEMHQVIQHLEKIPAHKQ